jgi:cell division protein FtsQ
MSKLSVSQIVTRIFTVLILLGMIAACWYLIHWLYKPENFPLTKVELMTELQNQESTELQQVAARALKGGFFSLNTEQFRVELLKNLPWIKSVSVRKLWPETIQIAIKEHKPVGRWLSISSTKKSKAHLQMLSNEGLVFQPELTKEQMLKFSNFVLLTGPDSQAGVILDLCSKMNKRLTQIKVYMKRCGMNERRSWMISLTNNMDIKLGKNETLKKLEQLIQVLSGHLKQYVDSIHYVDLRYTNGFSIKWHPEINTEARLDEKSKETGKE